MESNLHPQKIWALHKLLHHEKAETQLHKSPVDLLYTVLQASGYHSQLNLDLKDYWYPIVWSQ